MTAMVSARIPRLLKREAEDTLARMGVSHTQLIKAAYEYVAEQGKLPTTKAGTQENRPMRLLLGSDVLGASCAHHVVDADVRKLLVMASFGDVELWVSAHDMCDIMRHAMLNKNLLDAVHVCELTPSQLAEAARCAEREFDVALMVVVAQSIEADAIVTYDAARFAECGCDTLMPANVAAQMRDVQGLEFTEVVCVPD